MIADSVIAELGMHKNQSFTKLEPGSDPLTLEKKFHTIHTKTFSDTATLVFVHQNSLLDPLDSNQSITNGNGLKLDKIDLPPEENNSPRSNSGSSSSYDDKTVILPGAVSDTRKLFEPDRGSKPQPTRWPTSKSVLKIKSNPSSQAKISKMGKTNVDPSNQIPDSDSDLIKRIVRTYENSINLDAESNQTTGNISYTIKPEQQRALSTPPQSPLLKSFSLIMPPQPVKAKLDVPPSNNPTTGNVERTERDQTPESNPSLGTSEPKRLDKDGTKETTETPARNLDALACPSPPNQRKALGSAPGESDAIHDRNQRAIAEDLPRTKATIPDAKFFNSSDRNKPTFNPSKQNQNPWDLFGSPYEVKIYSALTCGLACGVIATISVPAAPIVAGVVGITAGAIVGYAIAESISKDKEKTIQK